ncbi:MAG: S9 family peptidase [Glaciecola sp.]|jgi:dipeptidyl-peptidase-4
MYQHILAGIALASLLVLPQPKTQAEELVSNLTIERIFSAPALAGAAPRQVKLSPDGQRVTYIQAKATDNNRFDLWEYHIASATNRLLFDADDLHTGDESLSDEEKARRERMRLSGSGIVSYVWNHDGSALLFPLAGDAYFYDLTSKQVKRLLDTPEFETDLKFSPLGTHISYIRHQNLYIMDIASGKERAITKTGGGHIKFGMAEFVAQEEMSRLTGYWWAPDEAHIAFTRIDERPVDVITRSEIYADSIKMIEQKYPKAGTDNVLVELYVQALATDKREPVDLGAETDIYLPRVNWANAQRLTYQWQSRDQKSLELRAYDLPTKTQTVLVKEQAKTWINLHNDLRFLKNSEQLIWASERDGFKHLYLYNNDGSLVKQLTSGDWVVTGIDAIDEKAGVVYFSGRKDTPLESHLYQVSLTQGDITRLTPKGQFNHIAFSADASLFANTFSTINTPPQTGLYRADGSFVTWLAENALDQYHPLSQYYGNWIAPEFGTIKAEDGTDLYYRLYKPANMSGKHPVIVYHYGGPIAQVVTNRWGGDRGLMFQYWAQQGYVVFSIDNRGSNYRGKAFEDPIYQAMGGVEVDDQLTGVKFLHTLPYVDKNRIGVYGHSYGGYMTLMSMFRNPDVYAAGVSGAPVTEWRLYDTHYTERYMGDPRVVADKYDAASVFPYATNLKGELLILHGMADDNVLFTHATKLYKHLQDNAILFHAMDYPGKKHSIRGKITRIHMFKTITKHFDTHMKK